MPVISVEGLHQLHIFIFILAVVHVCYSCLTVLVGLLQVSEVKTLVFSRFFEAIQVLLGWKVGVSVDALVWNQVHSWKKWEIQAHSEGDAALNAGMSLTHLLLLPAAGSRVMGEWHF